MPSHPFHHPAIRAFLGLGPTEKLPAEGMPVRILDLPLPWQFFGIEVWVNPLGPNPTKHKRSTHRVMARCSCGRVLSFGRLHQHKCKPIYAPISD